MAKPICAMSSSDTRPRERPAGDRPQIYPLFLLPLGERTRHLQSIVQCFLLVPVALKNSPRMLSMGRCVSTVTPLPRPRNVASRVRLRSPRNFFLQHPVIPRRWRNSLAKEHLDQHLVLDGDSMALHVLVRHSCLLTLPFVAGRTHKSERGVVATEACSTGNPDKKLFNRWIEPKAARPGPKPIGTLDGRLEVIVFLNTNGLRPA